jgi:hypothetical protein
MVMAQKQIEWWKRIENSEISPHSYRHLTFYKLAKNICWRMKTFPTKNVGKTGYPHVED